MGLMRVTIDYRYQTTPCSQRFFYWNDAMDATFAMAEAVLDAWEFNLLPVLQAATVTQTVFDKLSYNIQNNSASRERVLTGKTGAISATIDQRIPPALVANCRKGVSDTFVLDTGAPYTGGRPIARGRWYQSGLPLDLMDGDGVNTASAHYGAFTALLSVALSDLIDIGGTNWLAVVLGYPLPAKPATTTYPAGRPARPYVVAPITGSGFVEWTKIDRRDPT